MAQPQPSISIREANVTVPNSPRPYVLYCQFSRILQKVKDNKNRSIVVCETIKTEVLMVVNNKTIIDSQL